MGDVLNRGTKDRPLWYCRYLDENGVRRQRATGQPSKALARRYLAEVEAKIARGEVGIREKTVEEKARATVTVRELAERFLVEYANPRIKDLHVYRAQARSTFRCRIPPALGNRTGASVTTAEVEQLRDRQLADGLTPGSVAQTLAAVSKLYEWAIKAGLVACANPVHGCARTRSAEVVDFLDRVEVGALLAHTEAHAYELPAGLHAMIATASYGGLRKGELFGLRWQDVAFEAGRLDVNRSYRGLPKRYAQLRIPPIVITLIAHRDHSVRA